MGRGGRGDESGGRFRPGCGLGQVPSPFWASVSSSVKWVHPFPAAGVTTPHKLSGLKQHTFIILHSGGSGVHRGLPRLWLTCQQCCVLPESPEGENPLPAFPAFWRAPAFLGSRPLPPTTASDGLSHAKSLTLALPSPLHPRLPSNHTGAARIIQGHLPSQPLGPPPTVTPVALRPQSLRFGRVGRGHPAWGCPACHVGLVLGLLWEASPTLPAKG